MRGATAALLVCLASSAAWAQGERPAMLPTRDCDITYRTMLGDKALEQRFRWRAEDRIARVRPPQGGFEMLMDYRTHLLSVMRPAEQTVMEVPGGVPTPGDAPFSRLGTDKVAGLACQEWETRDPKGRPIEVCVTADGVVLRERAGDTVMIEAVSVTFSPQDSAEFRVPDNYMRVPPP